MSPIINPPPAPEGGSSNARPKDLLNKPCVIRPTGTGEWGPDSKTPGKTYVVCEVWELDRQGIVEHHEGMWIGWWKAVAQLENNISDLCLCRPTEGPDNSISLDELSGPALEVARRIAETIEAAPEPEPPAYEPGEEPFAEEDVF